MMSSGTSTNPSGAAKAVPYGEGSLTKGRTNDSSSALQPWQFFLLAGMLGATAAVIVATGQSMASIVTLSITVVAASMAGLGVYRMLLPFVSPLAIRPPELVGGRARAALEREKTLVLRAIKDLEFDRGMGKVAQADFDEMGARLRSRAVRLMQQLEGTGAHRERIEQELAQRLAKAPTKAPKTSPRIAVASACASCGTHNDADARFCKSCGAKLEAAR
jgi:hypothetical protein